MYERILTAIDVTPNESAVLRETRELARLTGATVHLLHVALDHLVPGDPLRGVPADELAEVEQALAQLRGAGVAAEAELVNATEHDISEVILRRARDLDVQLIVLGETLHGGTSKLFRGSVADRVIHHHPPCSVLLVH